ncbi:MAG: MTAP family purine nucleoside phosphorylase [Candidatus Saganbacteria bacterium]|nr:MTAP family purine nucleoside phosphorylase [Candidatus Saganbacteria bacterium]
MAKQKSRVAIIGGTGYASLDFLKRSRYSFALTRFGMVFLKKGECDGHPVYYLPRHGFRYSCPPHLINYRANLKALQTLKVDYILATSAVGTISDKFKPGDLVLLSDFIDFSKKREGTFCKKGKIKFTDVTEPYSRGLRDKLLAAARDLEINVYPEGVYVCAEGPRFETKAEIKAFEVLGGELVGMTNTPEVVLANELGIPYATLAIVTNLAAGKGKNPLTQEEVAGMMAKKKEEISRLFQKTITLL